MPFYSQTKGNHFTVYVVNKTSPSLALLNCDGDVYFNPSVVKTLYYSLPCVRKDGLSPRNGVVFIFFS